jgi:hypothetical protein
MTKIYFVTFLLLLFIRFLHRKFLYTIFSNEGRLRVHTTGLDALPICCKVQKFINQSLILLGVTLKGCEIQYFNPNAIGVWLTWINNDRFFVLTGHTPVLQRNENSVVQFASAGLCRG